MKKTLVAIAALIVAGTAQAESSVTLYGLVDAGVTYVNNQGGHSNIKMDTGVMNGNRWGLKGREEINSDLAGIFKLESGFKLDNGTSGQGGKLFGRQAFAGLDAKNIGSVTFGRQYDFMADIGDYTAGANQFGGVYMLESTGSFHNDVDLGSGATGRRIDNSIKFQSANYSGVTGGLMLGLGENAANKKAGRTMSAAIGYDGVPGLSTKVAYTRIEGKTDAVDAENFKFDKVTGLATPLVKPVLAVAAADKKTQNIGVGASYEMSFGKVNGVFTNTKEEVVGMTKKQANVYEAGYTQKLTPELSAGIGYQYFDNRTASAKKNDIHGVSLAIDDKLSARTDAYALAVYNKGKGTVNPDITGSGASDSKNQLALRVGLRHRF
jgi:predicted porin